MSAAKSPTKKELLPFQKENVASNQQGVPLPYLAGTRVIAVRWITGAMNEVTTQVPSNGKKG